ncbi:Asp-tRNA(Asn)/Glu-tRNA(Gln) amidotransferase subunit GatC [Aminithiophilus ramosus]|uniref:Aspartyl/glutamyl-tRNA(Asn/Gln) amidotransferase subunit C n=2 Tax=Synergistales TaxID=649776 RepID=A0A9Q7F0G1_9BACT|nr:Asp-tRNA(Asn)/Glu-tRNA(Gln) amidotransferase subunit GatC [Aminithiophilus ramosus]QTX33072.1 Asp-tRNA(Asn)/Glu-tRNA(Gln) amidotransferase subunit GatC [Aminithiophilus ramosus]QVL37164.1 Asp-tRNA(Asn)/Glu-tRNA(Gln) amidotransferase subunit GatC [Synergistota bacterium]
MAITEDEVRHVARLARLEVEAEEVSALAGHFNAIMGHFESLQEVDVSHVGDVVDVVADIPPWREDVVVVWDNREGALAQAPDRDDDFFRVPRILEEA